MSKHPLKALVPGVFAAAVLALVASSGATPPAATPAPAAKPQAAPMTGHHMDSAAAPKEGDMKAECEAMMAKKQKTQDQMQAMDATLDKLVAEMNAAKGSKEMDAMEAPMAAVINELVAQRKVYRSMMMEMQTAMSGHGMHHMDMKGAKGEMDCPMMRPATAPTDEKPKM